MAIQVVDIIIERKGKILLTKKGDFWILPGKQVGPDEDEMQCLEEVVAQEINDQVASVFSKLKGTIKGASPVRGGDVEVSVYVGDISCKKMSDVRDCNACWFSRDSIPVLRLSNITMDVLSAYYRQAAES